MRNVFRKKALPTGMCRATVTSVHSCKLHEYDVCTIKYQVIHHKTAKIFELSETFVDNFNLARCYEFSKFLLNSDVEFDNFDDLVGLTFDAWLERDFDGKNEFPVLTNKVILAHPFKKL